MKILNTPKREIEFVILEPIHHSWMVRIKRKFRSAHRPFNEYYGVSQSSIRRIEDLMNEDKVVIGTIALRKTGRAEIGFFPRRSK